MCRLPGVVFLSQIIEDRHRKPTRFTIEANLTEYTNLAVYLHYRSLVKTITPGIGKSNDDPLESVGIARFVGVEHVVANLASPTSVFRSHTSRCHQPRRGPSQFRGHSSGDIISISERLGVPRITESLLPRIDPLASQETGFEAFSTGDCCSPRRASIREMNLSFQ